MQTLLYLVSIMLLLIASSSHAASFDCTKASNLVEKTICADTELSKLDDLLAVSYKKALAIQPDSAELKTRQRNWLKNVRNQCQDVACLKEAYIGRLAGLEAFTEYSAGTHTPTTQQAPVSPPSVKDDKPDPLIAKYSKSLKIPQRLLSAPIVFDLNGEVIALPQYDNLASFIDIVNMMDNATGLVEAKYKITTAGLIVSLTSYDLGARQKTSQTLTFHADKSLSTGDALAVVDKIVVDDGNEAYELEKAEYLTYFFSAF